MANLVGVPSKEFLKLLEAETLDEVVSFSFIGHRDVNIDTLNEILGKEIISKADIESYIYYEDVLDSAYFDGNGVPTFEVIIDAEDNFDRYNYAVALFTKAGEIATIVPTPKFVFSKGIGGVLYIKIAVTGKAGEIIYKNTDYLTFNELASVHFGTVNDFVVYLGGETQECGNVGIKDDLLDELEKD